MIAAPTALCKATTVTTGTARTTGTIPPYLQVMDSRSSSTSIGYTASSGLASTSSEMDVVMPQETQSRTQRKSRAGSKANGKVATKRASRAGERSVAKLNPSQLARKRANDRDAQRAIRQRTKEHVDSLEQRIEELLSGQGETEALKEARERNRELEEEVKALRSTIATLRVQAVHVGQDVNWTGQKPFDPATPTSFTDGVGSGYPNVTLAASTSQPVAAGAFVSPFEGSIGQLAGNAVGRYVKPIEAEDLGLSSDLQEQRSWIVPTTNSYTNNNFTAFVTNPAYSDPLHLPPMTPEYTIPSSFLNQPSTSCWELPERFLPPTSPVDSMLISIIHQERMRNNGMAVYKPPSYRNLFMDLSSGIDVSSDPISTTIATVLHATAMQTLPEKVASFWAIHKLLRWQINPTLDSYEEIPDWFSPRPSQLVMPHASWVSQVKFPKLRDKIINNQELYANDEFIAHYSGSLSVNWPYQDLDVLTFVGNEVKISPMFERHIMKLSSWTLGPPFTLRYPELEDSCNFSKVSTVLDSVQEWPDA